MAFSQPLSGIAAQSKNLDVIGNNIANSQTVGFKGGNALFADVFAGANSRVGLGTSVSTVRQDFGSGDIENTGRGLDLAIAGEGFFRLEEPNGEAVYSRNGQFSQDADGFLVNATGQRLTGYGLSDPEDPFSEVQQSASEPLQIPRDNIPANATTEASATYNLGASTIPGEGFQQASVKPDPSASDDQDVEIDYHFSDSYEVFDSLGNSHTVTQYFEKIDQNSNNEWGVRVALDGVISQVAVTDPTLENNTFDNTTGGNRFRLSFNENGELLEGTDANGDDVIIGVNNTGPNAGDSVADLSFAAGNYGFDGAEIGAEDSLEIELDPEGTTQFGNGSFSNSLSQDGNNAGRLAGIEVQKDGTVQRNFTNGESKAAGQVTLASFVNQEGLQPDGDNNFRATPESGEPTVDVAGTGLLGSVEAGAVENSNVDLASELVDTIIAQRAYQANSTSISTQDELLQTVIQL